VRRERVLTKGQSSAAPSLHFRVRAARARDAVQNTLGLPLARCPGTVGTDLAGRSAGPGTASDGDAECANGLASAARRDRATRVPPVRSRASGTSSTAVRDAVERSPAGTGASRGAPFRCTARARPKLVVRNCASLYIAAQTQC